MVFVFWQGIISIHQQAFLEALAASPAVTKVVLVVEQAITPYRKNMGWEAPEIKGVEIDSAPSVKEIYELIDKYREAVHVMSGIKVGTMLSTAFEACIKSNCKVGIMTEPYNATGLKGKFRTIKYRYYQRKYAGNIQFILAIGRQGVQQFSDLGFIKSAVFPWAYFININALRQNDKQVTEERKIIYAGRIEEGKGIYSFVAELIKAGNKNYQLDMYGAGPDEEKIKKLVAENDLKSKINFFPFLKHDELLKRYVDYDWVVLPSTQKDGWGVIVSEGLLNGLKAICSNICGVSWVIKDGVNGVVFDWGKEGGCAAAIKRMLGGGSFADAQTISSLAQKTISGKAGADYFLQIMDCVYKQKQKPPIPWE